MKEDEAVEEMEKILDGFISHMVQMKACFLNTNTERVESFISHMVQMKELIIDKGVNMTLPLYPTWFRWKLNC